MFDLQIDSSLYQSYIEECLYYVLLTFQTESNNLGHLLTFIMTFMGSSSRMRNPHMRAHLAEALEALMPQTAQTNSFTSS